jgi:hypothetical protein
VGDLLRAYSYSVKGKDDLRKLQGGPLSVGKDPGMETAFPYAGNFVINLIFKYSIFQKKEIVLILFAYLNHVFRHFTSN